MSRENYFQKLLNYVTGRRTNTCLPAAIDLMSEGVDISEETYVAYDQAVRDQEVEGVSSKRTRRVIRMVFDNAGGSSYKNKSFRKANTPDEVERVLENARQGGRRVIAWTEEGHTVGLEPTNDGRWRMVGTHVPEKEELESDEVARYIHKSKGRRNGDPIANIVTLPPAKKKRK